MTKIKLFLLTITAALAMTGCKKSDDGMSNAQKSVESAAENVREQAKDVAEETREVADQKVDLEKAKADLARARSEFTAEAKLRLTKIDARIGELRASADAKSRAAADSLQVQRDKLAMRIDNASAMADDRWDEFKTDVGTLFTDLERDLDSRF